MVPPLPLHHQVAEERSLAGKCGNPLCSKPFSWQEPRVKYRSAAELTAQAAHRSSRSVCAGSTLQHTQQQQHLEQ
jgi:hypothetical protein